MLSRPLQLAAAVLLATLAGALIWWLLTSRTVEPPRVAGPPPGPPVAQADGTFLQENFPAEEIFRRTLWRHPGAGDRILEARRREWSDPDGVSRWEVYLAFEAGPETARWLATNPFGLTSASAAPAAFTNAPAWFPREPLGLELLAAPGGKFVQLNDPETNRIYIASSGGGFTRPVTTAAPEAAR